MYTTRVLMGALYFLINYITYKKKDHHFRPPEVDSTLKSNGSTDSRTKSPT